MYVYTGHLTEFLSFSFVTLIYQLFYFINLLSVILFINLIVGIHQNSSIENIAPLKYKC